MITSVQSEINQNKSNARQNGNTKVQNSLYQVVKTTQFGNNQLTLMTEQLRKQIKEP